MAIPLSFFAQFTPLEILKPFQTRFGPPTIELDYPPLYLYSTSNLLYEHDGIFDVNDNNFKLEEATSDQNYRLNNLLEQLLLRTNLLLLNSSIKQTTDIIEKPLLDILQNNNNFDIGLANNAIWSGLTINNANLLFGDSKLGLLGTTAVSIGTQVLSLLNNNSTNSGISTLPSISSLLKGAGAGAGVIAGLGVNYLGNKVLGDSAEALIATGITSSAASTAASALTNGLKLSSAFSNTGSLTNAGIGVANIALDALDPVRKSKWENAANMAAGAAMLIPAVGWGLGAGILAFNAIGHAAGKKANTITMDKETFEKSGGSYTGSLDTVNKALADSGAKYSLWASNDRHKANRRIAEATRLQNLISDITNNAEDRRLITQSMSAVNSNKYGLLLQGNYNLSAIRVGRHGFSLQNIATAKRVVSALKFQLKPVEQPEPIDSFQQGGVLELSLLDIPEEYLLPLSTVEEVTLDSILPEFREGGKVNVIPEGALHARLHHMENADNLTKKGIPVVAEKEGGELEQLAEIERNEVIIRLEITKKLEELLKNYYSDDCTLKQKDEIAIEAGKLLTYELLQNTVDNTGLLNEV